jgi:predicted DNA-binding protein|tara:strand:+ start:3233 stop:3427 length:195 start_codon:yes stop_codon:yes gene_type:complete
MGGAHKPHKKTLSAWIDVEKREALRDLAKRRGVSVAEILEELIDERISQISPKKQAGKKEYKNK